MAKSRKTQAQEAVKSVERSTGSVIPFKKSKKAEVLPEAPVTPEHDEHRKRRYREDLELAIKGLNVINRQMSAQCEIFERVLQNRLETMP